MHENFITDVGGNATANLTTKKHEVTAGANAGNYDNALLMANTNIG